MQNAFEFADNQEEPETDANGASEASDPLKSQKSLLDDDDQDGSKPTGSRRSTITERPATLPFLSLASFRMVVLADELLESFFSEDLPNCWHLEPLTEDLPPPKPTGATGRFANFVGSFMTDENKDYLSKLADDIGKRLDIQHVEQKPSLGRLTGAAAMQEPQERATLLSTTKTQSRQTSPLLPTSPYSAASMRQAVNLPPITPPSLSPSLDKEKEVAEAVVSPNVAEAAEKEIVDKALPSAPKDQILGLGIMDERPRFAIDDAGDEDSDLEDDGDVAIDDDAALMNGTRSESFTYNTQAYTSGRCRCVLIISRRTKRRCRCQCRQRQACRLSVDSALILILHCSRSQECCPRIWRGSPWLDCMPAFCLSNSRRSPRYVSVPPIELALSCTSAVSSSAGKTAFSTTVLD